MGEEKDVCKRGQDQEEGAVGQGFIVRFQEWRESFREEISIEHSEITNAISSDLL